VLRDGNEDMQIAQLDPAPNPVVPPHGWLSP
jgi:hypothetical protein